jgi:hypothetical protein
MASVVGSRMSEDDDAGAYTGWIAAGVVIAVVLAIGAGLWFHFHP